MKHEDELHPAAAAVLDARLRRLHRGLEPSAEFDAALARRLAAERESIARAQAAREADRAQLENDLAARLRRLRRDAWIASGLWLAGGTATGAAAWQLAPMVSGALGAAPGVAGGGVLELAWAFAGGVLVAGGWVARRLTLTA